MERKCSICTTSKTQSDKKDYPKWYRYNDGHICHACYKKVNFLKNREYATKAYWKNPEKGRQRSNLWRKNNPDKYKEQYQKPRIKFKGSSIMLKFNPRTGICLQCEMKGRTEMHHLEYSRDDPLANTVELCPRCHHQQHPRPRNKLGQFTP